MTLVNHIWEVEEKNRTLAAELKAVKEYNPHQGVQLLPYTPFKITL